MPSLEFPAGGLDRRFAYPRQRPFTTVSAKNVRPDGTLEGRQRGGSRPGLAKAFSSALGDEVRLLTSVSIVPTDGSTVWRQEFNNDLWTTQTDVWTTPSWTGIGGALLAHPEVDWKYAAAEWESTRLVRGVVRSAIDNPAIDETQAYSISLAIEPENGRHHGSYDLYFRMDATTAAASTLIGGKYVLVHLEFVSPHATGNANTASTGAYTGFIRWNNGAGTQQYDFVDDLADSSALAGSLVVTVTRNGTDDDIVVAWRGTEITYKTLATSTVTIPRPSGSPTTDRFGFTMVSETGNTGGVPNKTLVDALSVKYFDSVVRFQENRSLLTVVANGNLWTEASPGVLTQQTAHDGKFGSDGPLMAVDYLQKIYIADHGIVNSATGADGTFPTDTSFDSASFTDWTVTLADISANEATLTVLNSTGSLTNTGTYRITAIAAGALTVTPSIPDSLETSVKFRIERGSKVYDPLTNALSVWATDATAGTFQNGCPLITAHLDRIVLAAPAYAPHSYFMSRIGDPLDWNFGADSGDPAKALADTTFERGSIGQPITALIPFSDDTMLIGTSSTILILRGDLGYSGYIDFVSRGIGILHRLAWAHGPNGEIGFLTRDGLYGLNPGGGQFPQPLSRRRIPQELIGLNPELVTPHVIYDIEDRGFHIHIVPRDAGPSSHWWFDWDTKSFWPVEMQFDHEPFAIYRHDGLAEDKSRVLLGCRDGYIRQYVPRQETDDGTGFTSEVMYGPFRLGRGDDMEGMVAEVVGIAAENSGDVTWSVHVGETPEAAAKASAFASGTLSAGINTRNRPRARGTTAYLKLTNVGDRRWAIENLHARFRPLGRQRIG